MKMYRHQIEELKWRPGYGYMGLLIDFADLNGVQFKRKTDVAEKQSTYYYLAQDPLIRTLAKWLMIKVLEDPKEPFIEYPDCDKEARDFERECCLDEDTEEEGS